MVPIHLNRSFSIEGEGRPAVSGDVQMVGQGDAHLLCQKSCRETEVHLESCRQGECSTVRAQSGRYAGPGVHSCVSGHIRGWPEGATRVVGSRQAGRHGSAVGKDMLYGRAEWGSDAFGRLLCG